MKIGSSTPFHGFLLCAALSALGGIVPRPTLIVSTNEGQTGFSANLIVEPGRKYAVQSSGDLGSWTNAFTFLAFEDREHFNEQNTNAFQFFRLLDITASVPPPANDHFANALVLQGNSQQVTLTNSTATAELGEPAHRSAANQSVWFRWTAPSAQQVTFDTFGSTFDTVIAVYTGTQFTNLQHVASNDDSGIGRQSRVVLSPVEGTIYHIAVDSYVGPLVGDKLQFNYQMGMPPSISFTTPSDLQLFTNSPTIDLNIATSGNRVTLQDATGSVLGILTNAPFTFQITNASPRNHVFARAEDSAGRFSIASVLFWVTDNPLSNDLVSGASIIQTETVRGTTVGANLAANEPDASGLQLGSAWYRWTAPGTSSFAVSIDPTNSAIVGIFSTNGTLLAVNMHESVIKAVENTPYLISVQTIEPREFDLVVRPTSLQPHSNDDFNNRIVLSGSILTGSGDNTYATPESGEPAHWNSPTHSLWWSWTATQTSTIQVQTRSPDVDTVLAVYTGTSLASLQLIAADDDSGPNHNSVVSFTAVAGTTYHFAVDTYDFEGPGALEIVVRP